MLKIISIKNGTKKANKQLIGKALEELPDVKLPNHIFKNNGGTFVEVGESLWPAIRDGCVAVRGPEQISVNNSFTKILKPIKGRASSDSDTGLIRPMIKTIGFREYVQWRGSVRIAFAPAAAMPDDLSRWLTMISYLGKRGGFVQAIDAPKIVSELPRNFTELKGLEGQFPLNGTLQIMDDCSPKLSFEQVNIYTSKTIRQGKDRILHHVILPYRLTRSSRGYSLYERFDVEEGQ